MSLTTWHERLEELRDFLMFWGPLPDKTRSGDGKKTWKADLRRQLDTRDDKTLDAFAARMQARYDEIETTRGTVTTRANSLLLFVGVLTTGAGVIAQSLVGAPGLLVGAFVLVGVLLLYSTVAAAVLAVRAQLVSQWDIPQIKLEDAVDERGVRLTYSVEIFVAADQNTVRVRRPVAFLRDGQKYAIAAIAFIAVLAALSVAAATLKPPADAAGPGASPVPSATAVPPSAAPTRALSPTPAIPSVVVTSTAPGTSPSPALVGESISLRLITLVDQGQSVLRSGGASLGSRRDGASGSFVTRLEPDDPPALAALTTANQGDGEALPRRRFE